ncbi:Tubulin polyglutamylase TTLL5, partial [Pseudolycoriella hygida]
MTHSSVDFLPAEGSEKLDPISQQFSTPFITGGPIGSKEAVLVFKTSVLMSNVSNRACLHRESSSSSMENVSDKISNQPTCSKLVNKKSGNALKFDLKPKYKIYEKGLKKRTHDSLSSSENSISGSFDDTLEMEGSVFKASSSLNEMRDNLFNEIDEKIVEDDEKENKFFTEMPAAALNVTYRFMNTETKLLRKILSSHGLAEAEENQNCNLLWTGVHIKPDTFRNLKPYQRVNHFPRSYELTRKDRLYKNIEKMQHLRGFKHFDFVPLSFMLPLQYRDLVSAHRSGQKGPWIVKPAASSRGRGIFIVNSPDQISQDEHVLVSRYIADPLCIDGHKCDIRLYFTNHHPQVINGGDTTTSRLPQHPVKTDEIEILESAGREDTQQDKMISGWICCAPCIWLRTSATVHKIAITTATLLVTSLLVASPVLFLLSTAPSQIPKDCYAKNQIDCTPTRAPAPECTTPECQSAALSILARMNWKLDPCKEFRDFGCSSAEGSLKAIKSAQEIVDLQMLKLLTQNTTSGLYRKLGRLYGSCLRQTVNSSTIRLILDELGGYLPIGAIGPSKIDNLISKIIHMGPNPLISTYYDLSYGKMPQTMLVVDGSMETTPVLQNPVRWTGPKAAPFYIKDDYPVIIHEFLDTFLPKSMSNEYKRLEKSSIIKFIKELNGLRKDLARRDFSDSYVIYNVSALVTAYPYLHWTDMIPDTWSGPILLRSAEYLKSLQDLLSRHPTRVIHNSLLVAFALTILPPEPPNIFVCTKATMWAMPEISSALYIAQFSNEVVNDVINRADMIFEVLKAYLKRAPSLKGAALVKLSQLKIQVHPWPALSNQTRIAAMLEKVEINSGDWFENILQIYKARKNSANNELQTGPHTAWAYPTIAKIFYDGLSHSIVVPLSVIIVPYFDARLPSYLHFSSVGISIAKEILRSITKNFETKVMQCVPPTVNIFSNASRMDLLIQSGGMQIAYHSLLSLTGPNKGMVRLPGLNLSPTQIFFLVTAQEVCAESAYFGIDTYSEDFSDILGWLIAQGGSATEVFQCPYNSMLNSQKSCNMCTLQTMLDSSMMIYIITG